VVSNPNIDLVIIATPLLTHFSLVKACLLSDKHVLVTKPFVSTTAEASELIDIASRRGLVLMVDHTFLHTGSVKKLIEIVEQGSIGELLYFDSVRVNLGLFQPDSNVIWDLAPHDLSILLSLYSAAPRFVSATGISHFKEGHENVAYLTVKFDNQFMAHFHMSWVSPVKIRKTIVGGSKQMIIWDDLDPEYKLKIYDTGIQITPSQNRDQLLADYRIGSMLAPVVSTEEALSAELSCLAEKINAARGDISSAILGRRIVRILEAAETSLRSDGRLVALHDEA
jgi:predicted dehydrogenase